MPLYGERLCSYRLEPYWSYELCHGRYILQYYMHKEGKGPRIEYYLGQYRSELTKQVLYVYICTLFLPMLVLYAK